MKGCYSVTTWATELSQLKNKRKWQVTKPKPMKDRLTLWSEDCKITLLLIHHSENISTFKANKMVKDTLNVMWIANKKAWVARGSSLWSGLIWSSAFVMSSYLILSFISSGECYTTNSSTRSEQGFCHSRNVEDEIHSEFDISKDRFLSPNTMPIFRPMDEQVISNFNKIFILVPTLL